MLQMPKNTPELASQLYYCLQFPSVPSAHPNGHLNFNSTKKIDTTF